MAQLPTKRYEAYLRKMAIDGYIVQVDTTDINEMTKALGSIGRNISQIAKRMNAGGALLIRPIWRRYGRDWSRYGSYKDASY